MKHNIDNCFIDSVIKKDLFKSSLKKTSFIIDEIKKSKDPLLLAFLNQFSNYGKKKINKFPKLRMDVGDLDLVSKFFPKKISEGFNGDIMRINFSSTEKFGKNSK